MTHCPTCGASDDGSVNGWVHRAQTAEAECERLRIEWDKLNEMVRKVIQHSANPNPNKRGTGSSLLKDEPYFGE